MAELPQDRKRTIAHELNNLLAAIQGNADLMRGDFVGAESVRESLDEIDKAVGRARDLTRQLAAVPEGAVARPATPAPPHAQAQESRGATVLIADDEEPVRRVASRLLARSGYAVREASDGAEALRMLAAAGGEVDLLVTDIIMPEMGGLELARRVAADFPSLPILLISGYSETHEVAQGLPSHLDLLRKPFSGDELTSAVERCLARARRL